MTACPPLATAMGPSDSLTHASFSIATIAGLRTGDNKRIVLRWSSLSKPGGGRNEQDVARRLSVMSRKAVKASSW